MKQQRYEFIHGWVEEDGRALERFITNGIRDLERLLSSYAAFEAYLRDNGRL